MLPVAVDSVSAMFARAARQVLHGMDASLDRLRPSPPGIVLFIYHRIGGRSDSPVDLPVDLFRAQLDLLGNRVVSLADALARPRNGAVVLTFDDGTADWSDVVLPELEARNVPATFYVSTDFVDRRLAWPDGGVPISWKALADMAQSPLVTLGSHTHTHRVLRGVSGAVAADELRRSFELLDAYCGLVSRHFAYPKGVLGSPAAEVQVRRLCTSAALAGNQANGPVDDVHRLGRHALTRADDLAAFTAKAAGGRRLEGAARARRDAWATRPQQEEPLG
jgi:peptidoglycan/xylan/chitin deacetylase (PgdA/CDA1 family)